jgi:hypothetical protein
VVRIFPPVFPHHVVPAKKMLPGFPFNARTNRKLKRRWPAFSFAPIPRKEGFSFGGV